MDCDGLNRVRQDHRLGKTELSDDTTQSFQQRDSTQISQCILGIGENQQCRKRVFHVNIRTDMAAKINLSRSDSQRYFIWERGATPPGLTVRLLPGGLSRFRLAALGSVQ